MKFHVDVSTIARFLWVVAIGVVVVGSLSPGNSSLMRAVASFHVPDKVLHFGGYVFLASLPVLGLRGKREALVGGSSMVLLGLLMEIAQHFVPGRSPEVADEVANVLGVACGMALAFPFRRRQSQLSA